MQHDSEVIDLCARLARPPSGIDYTPSPELPKLAWLARLAPERGTLSVRHGSAVECRPTFLVEGVWDGPFESGEFHRGAHLFGSGIRLDDGVVYFMPSCALVDRLFYCWDGGDLLVANSLIALLAATGASLDPKHDYLIEARAILAGVERYATAFHVRHPSIERFHQIFHTAMVVRGGEIALERTVGLRSFASFAQYVSTLRERLAAICANAADPGRRTPLAAFGTLSSGYDSSTVAVLVKDLGVRRYFTYAGAWDAHSKTQPEYQTAAIAEALGIETIPIDAPRDPRPEDDLLLRSASPLGQQMPMLAMARHIEENAPAAIVFTGYHGGVVWDVNAPDDVVSTNIARQDTSGLDLSELRLKSGFINVAVPFFYIASIASIVAVSRSAELDPWKVGGPYDRPICRRLIETAGVPRGTFARMKGGIFGASARPANLELRAQYFDYVRRNVVPLPLFYARVACDRLTLRVLSRAEGAAKRRRADQVVAMLHRQVRRFLWGYSWYGRRNYRGTLYVWAVMELVRRLRERGFATSEPAVSAGGMPAARESAAR